MIRGEDYADSHQRQAADDDQRLFDVLEQGYHDQQHDHNRVREVLEEILCGLAAGIVFTEPCERVAVGQLYSLYPVLDRVPGLGGCVARRVVALGLDGSLSVVPADLGLVPFDAYSRCDGVQRYGAGQFLYDVFLSDRAGHYTLDGLHIGY